MTTYFPWENKKIEEVKKKVMDVLPPIPQPPTPEETGEAWKQVITETPEYALPFAPKVDVKQLGKALVGTASAVSSTPGLEFLQPLQIKAFHGSPYKFSKFATEKIGTGEGAQAFGYGHYLTESPEVAKTYAKPLPVSVKQKFGDAWSAVWLYHSGDKQTALKEIDDLIRIQGNYIEKYKPKTLEPIQALENYKNIKQQMLEGKLEVPSNIYETTIHKGKQPSEYTYLEWDKPIKPSDEIYNKVKEIVYSIEDKTVRDKFYEKLRVIRGTTGRITGSDVYVTLGETLGGWENTSTELSKRGISGIKYPTGSLSGVKGTGKYNYVVFNPEDITIEKIGGKSVLPPGIEKVTKDKIIDSVSIDSAERPWKVRGVKTDVLMGQFKTEIEANKYKKELESSGSLPMRVLKNVGEVLP